MLDPSDRPTAIAVSPSTFVRRVTFMKHPSLRTTVSRKLFGLAIVLLLTSTFAWSTSDARSQEPTAPSQASRIQSIFQQGQALEGEKKWGEALSHYERALKEIPSSVSLRERLDWTKLHYDLGRRYKDLSFQRSTTQLGEIQASDLYNEVLTKIDTHFVQITDWQQLFNRGTKSIDLALTKQSFAELHLANVPRARIETAQKKLRDHTAKQLVRNRRDATYAARSAAKLLGAELGIPPSAVIMEYVCAACGGLDTYSAYLTEDQLREVHAQIDGNFVGLGIEIKANAAELTIVSVIKGSPAQRAGIRAGDRIVSVDGQTTDTMSTDEAARVLQGRANTVVRLVVVAGENAPRSLMVRREHVEVPSVDEVRIIDRGSGIGYMKLVSFQRSTNRDVEAALWKLYRDDMKSLIVDVRGNPGGLLTAAVDVADKFVERGTIVSTRGRNKIEDFDYSARKASTWRVPLVVLIDENSASASEIFAAAIRGHRAGTVVGTRSYGKGSVQGIFPLSLAGAGVRLTTAKFYSPGGQPISNVGVQPDVTVHVAAKPLPDAAVTGATDAVLKAGIQAAKQKIAQR
jgi:carboxyl-terminal processing protease